MQEGEKPWQMWGQTGDITLREQVGAAPSAGDSVQLVNAQYRRPETWAMFFFAQILNAQPQIAVGDLAVNVDFQLQFGVGLNVFNNKPDAVQPPTVAAGQQGFVRFGWRRVLNDNITAASLKWSQTGTTPELDENEAVPARRETEFITAQTIQCSAQANVPLLGGPPGTIQNLVVRVGAFFAPLSHVRPDWFKMDGEQFVGGEIGGR